jgi:hypothetical protein
MQATGRRYLMGRVVSHMTMSLDGFIADPQDGVAELFGWYETSGGVKCQAARRGCLAGTGNAVASS